MNLLYSVSTVGNYIPLPVPPLYITYLVYKVGIVDLRNAPNISCYILGESCCINNPFGFRCLPIAL